MQEFRKFATAAAKEAGSMLKKKLYDTHSIQYKGEIDIVTEADRLSEKILVSAIRKRFPHHDILTEESEGICQGSPYRWIIDPLDGTTNYAHGYPVFCVSIALEISGEVVLGVVFNPMLNELFVAQRGKGAFLNRKRLVVSETALLSSSLLATGFPYDIRRSPNNNIHYFIGMAVKAQAIRRAGSAALDLAYVAAGRFDGFWELKLKPWDTAAGTLMLREAGGSISDIAGNPYQISSPSIVASNGKVHNEMLRVLQSINPLADTALPSVFFNQSRKNIK
jgi:myo-inositol-1(or 4)-monophosphatase